MIARLEADSTSGGSHPAEGSDLLCSPLVLTPRVEQPGLYLRLEVEQKLEMMRCSGL